MPAKGVVLRRLVRWALIACCAVALWFMGYEGGRSVGVEDGRQEGIAVGKEQGLSEALGFLDLEKRDRLRISVSQLISERLGGGPIGFPGGPRAPMVSSPLAVAEAQKLVDEICEEIAPGTWNLGEEGGNRIEADGFSVLVQGDPRVVAEVDMYLRSKDEYLAWKKSGKAAP